MQRAVPGGSGGHGREMPKPRYLCVLDFEATCDKYTPLRPQEIIEFPSILYDLEKGEVVAEFSSFVRPVHHPKLTAFCVELTGIAQSDVDAAPIFADVLKSHTEWYTKHVGGRPCLWVTCGDWDLKTALPAQCRVSGVRVPPHFSRWCNVKKLFSAYYRLPQLLNMVPMLEYLELELQGREHRGIDDCRNILRICQRLLEDGAYFRANGFSYS